MHIRIYGGLMERERQSIGETLKQLRRARRLTQKMLAADICAQSVISRAENNEELPNVMVLHQICERLNITIDQLMLSQPKNESQMGLRFQGIYRYFVQRDYERVSLLLEEPELLEALYSETDLQLYYYYLGSCEFFVEKNHVTALQSLRKGLSYTYNQNKQFVSTIEVQMLSCIGYVLKESGQREKALVELKKSYDFAEKLPYERKIFELAKVYYHYGEFLFEEKDYKEAFIVVARGLSFVQQFCSYYYLLELTDLNGKILQKLGKKELALPFLSLAEYIKNLDFVKSFDSLDFENE